ncbi:uncharacterized protein LY89DRAFT_659307, partial [Mollisia scopiformis]
STSTLLSSILLSLSCLDTCYPSSFPQRTIAYLLPPYALTFAGLIGCLQLLPCLLALCHSFINSAELHF